jgi:hypothetical protein
LSFEPEGKGTNLSLPLEYLLKIQKKRATTFLISDFQDENYEPQLKLAKQRFDLITINIIDPREETLPEVGLVFLEDFETGRTILVDTNDREILKKHKSLCIKKRQDRKAFFNSIGIDTIEIFTNNSLTEPIIKYFKFRENKH